MEIISEYKNIKEKIIPKDWVTKTLFDVAPLQRGFDLPNRKIKKGLFPVVYSNGIESYHNESMVNGPGVVTGRSGTLGKVHFIESSYWPHNTTLWVTSFNKNDPRFIFYFYKFIGFERFASGSGVPTLNRNDAHSFKIALPKSKTEQNKIGLILNDIDLLLQSLDKLIFKKENVKNTTMYQLLSDEVCALNNNSNWKEYYLEDLAIISKGRQLNIHDNILNEDFPHYNGGIYPSSFTSKANRPPNTIIISEGGNSCGYVQIINKPFWCGGHCYSIKPFSIDNNFLYYALKQRQNKIMKLRVGSGLPNIQKTNLGVFKLKIPEELDYQKKISKILLDMDKELIYLKFRRDKTFKLKEAMMYELLTGKTRLAKLDLIHD